MSSANIGAFVFVFGFLLIGASLFAASWFFPSEVRKYRLKLLKLFLTIVYPTTFRALEHALNGGRDSMAAITVECREWRPIWEDILGESSILLELFSGAIIVSICSEAFSGMAQQPDPTSTLWRGLILFLLPLLALVLVRFLIKVGFEMGKIKKMNTPEDTPIPQLDLLCTLPSAVSFLLLSWLFILVGTEVWQWNAWNSCVAFRVFLRMDDFFLSSMGWFSVAFWISIPLFRISGLGWYLKHLPGNSVFPEAQR